MSENTIKKSYTLEEIINVLDQDFPIASKTINLYYFSCLKNYMRKTLLEKVFSIEKTTILINIGQLFESFEERQAISLQEDIFKEIDDYIDTCMQVLFLYIIIDCANMYRELITDIKFKSVILLNTRLIPDELILQIQEDMEELFLS